MGTAGENAGASELDEKLAAAASAVVEADVLLLVTGAGWSADSGLPVYADIAQVPAYERQGLTYADVAQPKWIEKDPAIFYGFWGQALRDYRHTVPHAGFEFVQKWRLDKMKGGVSQQIRDRVQTKMQQAAARGSRATDGSEPYYTPFEDLSVTDMAGSFYCFTSNCDAHFYDFLPTVDIHDCHGNVELWQCANRDCKSGLWRAPTDWSMEIDPETLRAPSERNAVEKKAPTDENAAVTTEKPSTPRLGHSQGLGVRKHFLKFMPSGRDTIGWSDEEEALNWPRCGHCQHLARPAIFMFGDFGWKFDHAQESRWNAWRESVVELSREMARNLKVCILEVGCGKNVATCRTTSETLMEELIQGGFGDDVRLVRINPDFPGADDDRYSNYVISIRAKGLAAVQRIQELYVASSDGVTTSDST